MAMADSADLVGGKPRRRRRSRWAVRDINNLIVAKDRSEKKWWDRNSDLIRLLDNGKTVSTATLLRQKCQGDLVLDGEEWRCWQCGHYYYPNIPDLQLEGPDTMAMPDSADLLGGKPRRRRRSRWAVRDINNLIVAKNRSEKKWWDRNSDLIRLLDNGKTVKEIAAAAGRSERQIRVIREQLNDLRAVADMTPAAMGA